MNETENTASTRAKLSRLQKWLLSLLLELHENGDKRDAAFKVASPEMRGLHNQTAIWGVKWQPTKLFPARTRAESVNVSRALARLEARGLVIRQSKMSGAPDTEKARTSHESLPPLRCDHVLLTQDGRETANKITSVLLAVSSPLNHD